MRSEYPHLFSVLKIKGVTFKNRVFSTPNATLNYTSHGAATTQEVAYFETKAKGGCAQVTVGETCVDPRYLTELRWSTLNIQDPCSMASMSELALAIHVHGAIASIQLTHPGRHCAPDAMEGRRPIAPVAGRLPNGTEYDAMDEDMIEDAIEKFASAAAIAQRTGFDMCEIHGAHGWLIAQFLSTRTNKRKDKWGGSLENRARFPIAVIDGVRKACGPEFLIEFRISGDEFLPDGMKIDEVVEFVKMIEDRIDIIHVSAGIHDNPSVRENPQTLYRLFPQGGYTDQGCNVYLAEAVKKAVKIPVETVGGITTPELAEKILAEGKADIIGMGRPILADPELPNKARQGRRADIIPCIRCNECLSGMLRGGILGCVVNPQTAREMRWQTAPKPDAPRRVLVVGGGPGGMQAAITAAERGHKVTLYEKAQKLGGLLSFTDHAPARHDIKAYKDYLVQKTLSLVDVKLGTEATAGLVEAEQPDALILAVGSEPIVPDVPGVTGETVMSALEAYENLTKIGKNVAVIGGGSVGCEIGLQLAQSGHAVVLVEMKDERLPRVGDRSTDRQYQLDVDSYPIGDPTNHYHGLALMEQIERSPNFEYYVGTKCVGITPTGISVLGPDGPERLIEADTVIYAVGVKSRSAVVDELREAALNVLPIGDCIKPASIREATLGGYYAALDIV